jgi:hypothetical protein
MIKICKQYATESGSEGDYTETDYGTSIEALDAFDDSNAMMCVICESPGEHLRLMHGVGRINAQLGQASVDKVAPGETAHVVVWACRGEVPDGRGWRMIFMRENRSTKKPAEKAS